MGITIVFSWPATVIAATVVAFPLMYRTALGAFEQVNPTLLQAARTLRGLRSGGCFGGCCFHWLRRVWWRERCWRLCARWAEFGATLMLAGNIPGRTQTMRIAIFSAVEDGEPRAGRGVGSG